MAPPCLPRYLLHPPDVHLHPSDPVPIPRRFPLGQAVFPHDVGSSVGELVRAPRAELSAVRVCDQSVGRGGGDSGGRHCGFGGNATLGEESVGFECGDVWARERVGDDVSGRPIPFVFPVLHPVSGSVAGSCPVRLHTRG